jgi:protein-disulfide isomerase
MSLLFLTGGYIPTLATFLLCKGQCPQVGNERTGRTTKNDQKQTIKNKRSKTNDQKQTIKKQKIKNKRSKTNSDCALLHT